MSKNKKKGLVGISFAVVFVALLLLGYNLINVVKRENVSDEEDEIVENNDNSIISDETVHNEDSNGTITAIIEPNAIVEKRVISIDDIKPGDKVVIIDDLIATGGTIEAACKLVEQLGGEVVKIIFLMELAGLKGREKLAKYDVASVVTYEGK